MAEMSLLKEVMYLLLAALLIITFLGAFTDLYASFVTPKEELQAKGTIENLANFLSSLNESESDSFFMYSPKDYFFVAYAKGETNLEDCFNINCVCICEKNDCSGDRRYCKEISKPVSKFIPFRISFNTLNIINNKDSYLITNSFEDIVNEGEVEVISDKCFGKLVNLKTGEACNIEKNEQDKCVLESVRPIFEKAQQIAKDNNVVLVINSAYRTPEMQKRLWENKNKDSTYVCEPKPTCPHQTGCAVDVCIGKLCTTGGLPPGLRDDDTILLEKIMTDAGFVRYINEYWHFEYGTNRWQICQANKQIAC